MIAYIFRLPDGHRLLPHRNLTSPHSDGKAFSLPATAYGNLPLQRSDFDQTQVSRHGFDFFYGPGIGLNGLLYGVPDSFKALPQMEKAGQVVKGRNPMLPGFGKCLPASGKNGFLQSGNLFFQRGGFFFQCMDRGFDLLWRRRPGPLGKAEEVGALDGA